MTRLAEPYRLEKRGHNDDWLYTLTRADIPRERLCLQIIARTETEQMVAERVCAALAVWEGTPTGGIEAAVRDLTEDPE